MNFGRDARRSPARVRGPHGPEHNLIQRPDLGRSLQRMLGIRQPHIAPTLQEGVQPVVIVGDTRDVASTQLDGLWASGTLWLTGSPPGSNVILNHVLWNPATSGVDLYIRVVRVETSSGGTVGFQMGRYASTTPGGAAVGSQVLLEDRARWLTGQAPVGTLYQETRTGSPATHTVEKNYAQHVCSALGFAEFRPNVILPPGQGFGVALDPSDSQNLRTSWEWQEFQRGV